MERTRVRRSRIAGVVLAGVTVLQVASGIASAGPSTTHHARRSYVVRAGDTVWSIASRLAGSGDPRPVVDAIVRANHLSGALSPGRTVLLPSS